MPDLKLVQEAYDSLRRGNFFRALDSLRKFFEQDTRVSLREARDRIRYAYQEDIDSYAKSVAEEWNSGHFDGSRREVEDTINSQADGCNWTSGDRAFECLRYTHSDPPEPMPILDNIAWSCVRDDIIYTLKREHCIDVNERPPRKGEIECSSCGFWSEGEGDTCNDCKEEVEDDE